MMKVLVTGANGQLGHDVLLELRKRGLEGIGSDIHQQGMDGFEYVPMDITNKEMVHDVIERVDPDAVIHCAAWTAVDAAEDNRPLVMKINGEGTENIAEACKKIDCRMMYISTDYVFSGNGDVPWKPDDKQFAPLNVYGESKLAGEMAVVRNLNKFFIVRIAWVFGKNGKNFINTMLRLGNTHSQLRVVNDQVGTPTYTVDLARLLVDMITTEKYGYYHATNSGGYISWHEFAVEIFRQAEMKVDVVPVTTEEYGLSKARRPFNSRLDKSKLEENGFQPLPGWKNALTRYLGEIKSV